MFLAGSLSAQKTAATGGPDGEGAAGIAAALTDLPVRDVRQVGGGRNSRVYRVETAEGPFALKQYPSREDDPRDRQGTEWAALRWMAEHGLRSVPRAIAADRLHNFTLLSWVNGGLVRDVTAADIDEALRFLASIHAHKGVPGIPEEQLASEACLSGAEIERQVAERAATLEALDGEPALKRFLQDAFRPAGDTLVAKARGLREGAGQSFDEVLPQDRRSLVPSDFGFHNILRDADGRLTFIDFEYFGWDDPVKLVSDVVLHPGTPVEPALKQRFREGAARIYADDPDFSTRLDAFQPLFGLRWVLILLNEFHPERWRRRQLAGATETWAEAKTRQLEAARAMLAGLSV